MKEKDKAVALWLAGLVGFCGLHRFYLGKTGTGLLWFFTFGLLFIGQIYDLMTLGRQVEEANLMLGVHEEEEEGYPRELVIRTSQLPPSVVSDLDRLDELREQNRITETEHEVLKRKTLGL